jgi:hypothetical protein
MTTFAFVGGMLPLRGSRGVGPAENRAIGSVIAGGQTPSAGLAGPPLRPARPRPRGRHL